MDAKQAEEKLMLEFVAFAMNHEHSTEKAERYVAQIFGDEAMEKFHDQLARAIDQRCGGQITRAERNKLWWRILLDALKELPENVYRLTGIQLPDEDEDPNS